LDQSLLFIFIVGFTIITFHVSEHVTIVVDARASIGKSNSFIPFIVVRSGF